MRAIHIKHFKKNLLYIIYSVLILSFSVSLSKNTFAEDINTSVTINPSLTLTIPTNTITLNLDPATNAFSYQDLSVSVGTNNPTGYNLTMSAPSTNLVNTADSTKTIQTLGSGTYDDTTFTVNKWGYKNGLNNNYKAFTGNDTILSNDTIANNDTTTLRFASKIDYMNPSGTYQTEFTFAATANPTFTEMQDLDPTLCTTTPMTVVDNRDDQTYIIQRLADGNCWMMTNLNLGANNLTTDLTSANTNLSTTVTAATFNGWKKTSSTHTRTAGEFIPITASNSADGSATDSVSQAPYGTLYNFCATSAGTICTSSNTGNASYDICPAGWRLPTGGPNGEFQMLYNNTNYNTYDKMRAPISSGGAAFALAGYLDVNVVSPPVAQGSSGGYWSSTNNNMNGAMYGLSLDPSSANPVHPTANRWREGGFSVRCMMKDATTTISDITYLQDIINPDITTNTTEGATTTLRDRRDNQDYTVAKINGQLWMTRNLAIGCNGSGSTYGSSVSSKSLTSSNSNVSSSWSTPTALLSTAANSYSTSGYTTAAMQCNSTYGAWYNYKAATAGTISGSSNTTDATYDICPFGWRLPTYSEQSGITSYKDAYAPVTGGWYYNGSPDTTWYGMWWSATSDNQTTQRRSLYYNSLTLGTNHYSDRYGGIYVRCIAK